MLYNVLLTLAMQFQKRFIIILIAKLLVCNPCCIGGQPRKMCSGEHGDEHRHVADVKFHLPSAIDERHPVGTSTGTEHQGSLAVSGLLTTDILPHATRSVVIRPRPVSQQPHRSAILIQSHLMIFIYIFQHFV